MASGLFNNMLMLWQPTPYLPVFIFALVVSASLTVFTFFRRKKGPDQFRIHAYDGVCDVLDPWNHAGIVWRG
jgi:hypothetical protein